LFSLRNEQLIYFYFNVFVYTVTVGFIVDQLSLTYDIRLKSLEQLSDIY